MSEHLPIPEVRARLIQLAHRIERLVPEEAREIRRLAIATTRRSPKRKAKPAHPPMTAKLRDRIKALLARYPLASLQEVAELARTNPGRVSEVLHGDHDDL